MTTLLPVGPLWKLDLDHGARIVASTPEGQCLAIASEATLVTVAGREQSTPLTIRLREPARALAIAPDGRTLAVVGASRDLRVLSLESDAFGRELARWEAPVHDACEFSRDGGTLWAVGSPADDVAEVHCYDPRSSQEIQPHRFKPFIGECGFILTRHPLEDVMGLWACGGPDEIWNYWIRPAAGGIDFQHQPELDGWTPPVFNPRGDRFVALKDYELCAFAFPKCARLSEPMALEDDEDMWAESQCFLETGDDRVVVATTEGRIYVVALRDGAVLAEVALENHEPRPCYQVYKSLSKTLDARPCTDLMGFDPVGGDVILSVHSNGLTTNRKDTILLWHSPGRTL